MKKILIALLCVPVLAFAQTKEETEAWILSKIPYSSNFKYTFAGDGLIMVMPGVYGGNTTKRTMVIQNIKTISAERTDTYVSFNLKCDDDCVYTVSTDTNDKFVSESKGEKMFLALSGKIDPELIPRMEKALLRLVELNNGKARVIPFQKKKEAF